MVRVAIVLVQGVPLLGFVQHWELTGSLYCGAAVVVVPVEIEEVDLVDWDTRRSSAMDCG